MFAASCLRFRRFSAAIFARYEAYAAERASFLLLMMLARALRQAERYYVC